MYDISGASLSLDLLNEDIFVNQGYFTHFLKRPQGCIFFYIRFIIRLRLNVKALLRKDHI